MAGVLFQAISCNYLDIVPDDLATIEMVFQTRNTAQRMLFTCYDYIPSSASPWSNPGIGASDEVWNVLEVDHYYSNTTAFRIAKGMQNASDPYLNYWSGGQGGSNLFVGLRDCNIFLDNVDKVPDMETSEKNRWKAEVKVVKAYLHMWLLQLYGPIPFIDKNIPVSADPEDVKVVREPVDQVVEKIVALLDEAIATPELPDYIRDRKTELGRITKPIAYALKAKLLTYAASPLLNGNPDFAFYVDSKGQQLINPNYDQHKWELARDACKEAIDAAHKGGHRLYVFDEPVDNISDTTRLELTLRHTITKKYGDELIWGLGNRDVKNLVLLANTSLTSYHVTHPDYFKKFHSPTLGLVETFYTNNGVPIEEDKTYDYSHRYDVVDVPEDHKYYIDVNSKTALLHVYREPRFYAWIGFDNGKWFNLEAPNDKSSLVVHCKLGEQSGKLQQNYSVTGFFAKKIIPYEFVLTESSNTTDACSNYAFPIIRLSDLYLLYAECLNECKDAPDSEVYEYIQKVRDKAGLDKETGSLVETWAKYSKDPNKPKTKDGMRKIIQQERLIELCLEGQRFFDIRRWKLAMEYLNKPVMGWNTDSDDDSFYTATYVYGLKFTPRDYFWPIKLEDMYRNNKLQQSPLW